MIPLLVFLLLVTGCTGFQRPYRDPVSYSFEGEGGTASPAPEWHDFKGQIEETSKKVRALEEKHLW